MYWLCEGGTVAVFTDELGEHFWVVEQDSEDYYTIYHSDAHGSDLDDFDLGELYQIASTWGEVDRGTRNDLESTSWTWCSEFEDLIEMIEDMGAV